MLRKYIAILFVLAIASLGFARPCPTEFLADGVTPKPIKVIGDGIETILTGNHHWVADTVYHLRGWVYVGDGAFLAEGGQNGTLTIDPGTIIKGYPGQGDTASALIVTRESKIYAVGTEDCPIVMTALADTVDFGNLTVFGTTQINKGRWGSIIVLGKAPISSPPDNVQQIEGVTPNPHIFYGGHNQYEDPHDNSGIIKYLSIRYGGSILGVNNEINGLTMGGVGDGTEIDYVEAYCGNDDGFEWFGGTVNCKHLINAFCDDDGFDADQAYTGKGQFYFQVCDSVSNYDHLFEWDSDDPAFSGVGPFMKGTVYNFTGIGRGKNNTTTGVKQDFAMKYKEGTGGHLRNGIVVEYSQWGYEYENKNVTGSGYANWGDCDTNPFNDSEKRSRCKTSGPGADLWPGYGNPAFAVQDIDNYSILWWNLSKGMTKAGEVGDSTLSKLNIAQAIAATTYGGGTVWPSMAVGDPGIYYGPNFRLPYGGTLDPRPSLTGPAYTTAHPDASTEDPWFVSTPYIGAFSATDNWADKPWTALHQFGYFKPSCTSCGDANGNGTVNISDAVFLISFIFSGGQAPGDCNYANGMGDANGSGNVNISDAVYLISYIFSGGTAPKCQGQ
jgi:hypothetical protein